MLARLLVWLKACWAYQEPIPPECWFPFQPILSCTNCTSVIRSF